MCIVCSFLDVLQRAKLSKLNAQEAFTKQWTRKIFNTEAPAPVQPTTPPPATPSTGIADTAAEATTAAAPVLQPAAGQSANGDSNVTEPIPSIAGTSNDQPRVTLSDIRNQANALQDSGKTFEMLVTGNSQPITLTTTTDQRPGALYDHRLHEKSVVSADNPLTSLTISASKRKCTI